MKLSYALIACMLAAAGANAAGQDARNPFDPATAKRSTTHAAVQPQAPVAAAQRAAVAVRAPMLPEELSLPPVLPPALPPPLPSPARRADVPRLPPEAPQAPSGKPAKETSASKPAKESAMRITAASCQLKARTETVSAPAYGGIVTIALQGSGRDCVSAVMVQEPWLEAKDLSDPALIRLAVDANSTSMPRQSNVVIANAGQSVTVTLVQEGRSDRSR